MTTEDPRTIKLGTFPKGSRLPPVSYQFLDQDGDPEDWTSGTWSGEITGEQLWVDTQPVGLWGGSASTDVSTATVEYIWDPDDFNTVGTFRFILWSGNGSLRMGSPIYEYTVFDAPGPDPTV